jgi:hypothetical protein
VGRRSFTTRANRTRNITVKLTKSAYRKLRRAKGRRQRVRVSLVSRGSDNRVRRVSARVTMVASKAKKAKKKS